MIPALKPTAPTALTENPFKLIGHDWMLITAGTLPAFNTMTAAWGALGVLWDKTVATIYVRPTRHTFTLLEQAELFTLCFFGPEHRAALQFCGAHSGREVNKVQKTGLLPAATPAGAVYFEQARLVLECRKIYSQDLDPARFLDPEAMSFYSATDFHRQYIGEIMGCWKKD